MRRMLPASATSTGDALVQARAQWTRSPAASQRLRPPDRPAQLPDADGSIFKRLAATRRSRRVALQGRRGGSVQDVAVHSEA
jgi:hypothetical protein